MSEGNGAAVKEQHGTYIPDGPRDWDTAVSAAHLLTLGYPQRDVAEVVGVHRVTLYKWSEADWWKDAQREAMSKWLAGLQEKAIAGLDKGVQEDGRLALSVLERLRPELRPLPQQLDIDANVEINVSAVRRRLRDRLAIAAGTEK